MKKKRYANYDLLKIMSILLIIMHHYALWTKWEFEPGVHANKLVAQTLLIGGKLGVNLFVMITGYFLVVSKPKWQSLLNTWIQTSVISIVMYSLMVVFQVSENIFSLTTLLKAVFPFFFGSYWFVTSYSLMYVSIPIWNYILNTVPAEKVKNGLLVSFFVLSIYPLFYNDAGMNFAYPVWMMYLYCLGGYFKLRQMSGLTIKVRTYWQYLFGLLCVGVGINIGLQFIFAYPESMLARLLKFLGWSEALFYKQNTSPLLLGLAIVIFVLFSKWQVTSNKGIEFLSRGAFGAYLFQSSPYFTSLILWPKWVNGLQYNNSPIMIFVHGLKWALILFIIGVALYWLLYPVTKFLEKNICAIVYKIKKRSNNAQKNC